MFHNLFEEGKIGSLQLKNRMIVPPMLTQFAKDNGEITERYIRYYEEKAKGGFGLIIVEDNVIERRGAGLHRIAGMWSDELMEKHKELTHRIHRAGAKIAVQVYHAGREATFETTGGCRPVAPSAIQDPIQSTLPHELTTEEVYEMIETFAQAIRRAKSVGYDAVELHGAHGYLINQFLSPFSNKRTDEFGGTFMNRLQFPLRIIKRAQELIGLEYPIIYRITADELVSGGLTIEDTKIIAPILEKAGVAALHVSASIYKSGYWASAPTAAPSIPFVKYARELKKVVTIPIIAVNKINTPYLAQSILSHGDADFVAMGRASIADPHVPNKIRNNKLSDIVECIGCWQGCQGNLSREEPITCLVNPEVGKEAELAITRAQVKKNVLIVGGGPGGMQAAIVAAKRGHDVTLFEKTNKLGGQWLLAAVAPGKEQLNAFTVWQKTQLQQLGVKIKLETEVTVDMIDAYNPDFIVLATGAKPIKPKIKGIEHKRVVCAHDVLGGKVEMLEKVVVIGGGLVGAETAEHMAVHEKNVTLIEVGNEIAKDLDDAPKVFLMNNLKSTNTTILTEAKVSEITETGVYIEKDG
ncbi:MAG: FAD-dependent oxidoreductase, partial [Culicoidibacterales bacterium]